MDTFNLIAGICSIASLLLSFYAVKEVKNIKNIKKNNKYGNVNQKTKGDKSPNIIAGRDSN
ncbi:hypothetical protein P4K71_09080 [Bacillus cereus]|uniref:hypothetical protein n=1 Tax=Bacillus TaxID=1386 RepID=UPI000A367289|nr:MULTISPECIES: hypothetical protein [Bacillus]MEB8736529.1 hypothetical protein [Bacillus cereus]MDM5036143.1 hypothetical protein [Bacillus sp. OR-18]MEB8905356.1 hypothetical protein [Bacillus cereus]MEB9922969.1 hypothetical protein [Bacillus cereus]MEB9986141.1 hypothetical protein [Bacillus cereus]